MTGRWVRFSTAAIALTALLAVLTAGCASKPEAAAPGATPTPEQAAASQKIGQQSAAAAQQRAQAEAAQHH